MTPGTPRFPALERVFRAYLHEDLAAEYGGPEAAMRAFRDDASPAEWRRFQREAKRFASLVDSLDLEEVRTLVHRLRGTAASYGFPAVSQAAGRCEDAIRAGAPRAEITRGLDDLLGRLTLAEAG